MLLRANMVMLQFLEDGEVAACTVTKAGALASASGQDNGCQTYWGDWNIFDSPEQMLATCRLERARDDGKDTTPCSDYLNEMRWAYEEVVNDVEEKAQQVSTLHRNVVNAKKLETLLATVENYLVERGA